MFRPHTCPRFTRAIALAQNQLSKMTSLVQTYCASHRRQSLFSESRRRSIISSLVLKSDVSERNSSRFSVTLLVIRNPLQPILDSRTRSALTGTLHARSVYRLLVLIINSISYKFIFNLQVICRRKIQDPQIRGYRTAGPCML